MFREFATFGQYCLTSPVFCCNTIGIEFAALPAGQAAYNQVVNNFPDRGRTAGSGATPALYLWERCSLQGASSSTVRDAMMRRPGAQKLVTSGVPSVTELGTLAVRGCRRPLGGHEAIWMTWLSSRCAEVGSNFINPSHILTNPFLISK